MQCPLGPTFEAALCIFLNSLSVLLYCTDSSEGPVDNGLNLAKRLLNVSITRPQLSDFLVESGIYYRYIGMYCTKYVHRAPPIYRVYMYTYIHNIYMPFVPYSTVPVGTVQYSTRRARE